MEFKRFTPDTLADSLLRPDCIDSQSADKRLHTFEKYTAVSFESVRAFASKDSRTATAYSSSIVKKRQKACLNTADRLIPQMKVKYKEEYFAGICAASFGFPTSGMYYNEQAVAMALLEVLSSQSNDDLETALVIIHTRPLNDDDKVFDDFYDFPNAMFPRETIIKTTAIVLNAGRTYFSRIPNDNSDMTRMPETPFHDIWNNEKREDVVEPDSLIETAATYTDLQRLDALIRLIRPNRTKSLLDMLETVQADLVCIITEMLDKKYPSFVNAARQWKEKGTKPDLYPFMVDMPQSSNELCRDENVDMMNICKTFNFLGIFKYPNIQSLSEYACMVLYWTLEGSRQPSVWSGLSPDTLPFCNGITSIANATLKQLDALSGKVAPYQMHLALFLASYMNLDLSWNVSLMALCQILADNKLPWLLINHDFMYEHMISKDQAVQLNPNLEAMMSDGDNLPVIAANDTNNEIYDPDAKDNYNPWADPETETSPGKLTPYKMNGTMQQNELLLSGCIPIHSPFTNPYAHIDGISDKMIQNLLVDRAVLVREEISQTIEWIDSVLEDDESESLVTGADPETTEDCIGNLTLQLKAAKDEVRRLKLNYKNVMDELHWEKRKSKESSAAHSENLSELEELRALINTIVEERDQENTETATDDFGYIFPIEMNDNILIYGGHESWQKEMQAKIPGVRFMGCKMTAGTEAISREKTVWLQINCMPHGLYYKVMNVLKSKGMIPHYFSFASAQKCAVQLVDVAKESS